jgi:20S proteasome alpha/beta subunit
MHKKLLKIVGKLASKELKDYIIYSYSRIDIFVLYRTSIGLRGTDGVVFAVEKLVTSKLYEPGANRRLFNIDKHVGMAIGGLLADARQIVERARNEAAKYRSEYKGDVPLKVNLNI